MPGGSGKAKRSCPLCKPYKFARNSKERYTAKERAKREAMKKEVTEER